MLIDPKSFIMAVYISTRLDDGITESCGTAACIAGKLLINSDPRMEKMLPAMGGGVIQRKATEIIFPNYPSLDRDTQRRLDNLTHKLFHKSNWGKDFESQYCEAIKQGNFKLSAQVAAKKIIDWINKVESEVVSLKR
jgi:hypothetical protein